MKIPSVVLTLLILTSCGQGGGTDESLLFRAATPLSQIEGGVRFDELASRVLGPRCLICHGEFATEAGLLEKVVPGQPDSSPLYVSTRDGVMPRGGSRLSESELSLIRDYILGLLPKITEPITEPTPLPLPLMDYAWIRTQILEPKNCLRCHADMGTEAGLSVYIVPSQPDQSSLYLRTADRSMPRRGVPLDVQQLDAIRQYILNLKGNASE